MNAAGGKVWFTAAELAGLDLPGLSPNRNRVVEIAAAQGWAARCNAAREPLARKRAGRGGGFEYHIDVLPPVTQLALRPVLDASEAANDDAQPALSGWTWFDQQPDKVKVEARARLETLQAVEASIRAGLGKNAAVLSVASERGLSGATIWTWMGMVRGQAASDWLPALAPRRKGGGIKVDIDADLLTFFKSFYLRPSPVGFEESYRQTVKEAARRGIALPSTKTLTRRLRAEVPAEVIVMKRHGLQAVVESIPAQKRTRSGLRALEALNIDGHKWDVFVRFPGKNGQPDRIGRALSVVIQDLYSNKILGWRTGEVESSTQTRLAFGDVFGRFGIPTDVTLDNGRAFASKWITGGAATRFRGKIKDGDPLGLLTQLGVRTHWAKPHHGQAKPIERAFRDLEEIVSMHPLCQGAYTGNSPQAKPDDYATRAIDFDVFKAHVDWGIAEYNARAGRTTENARGRSFDDTFAASIAAGAPIGKATAEQLRLAMLTAENVRCSKRDASVTFYGNAYYAPALYGLAGKEVTVRFDPEDLQSSVHIYKVTGEYVCEAPIIAAVGFYDVAGAKARAKLEGDLKKTVREAAKAQALLSAHVLAERQAREIAEAPAPEPTVMRPVRPRRSAAAQAVQAAPAPDRDSFRDRFSAAVARVAPAETARRSFTILDGGLSPQSEPERPKK